jgi:hypothetical protein
MPDRQQIKDLPLVSDIYAGPRNPTFGVGVGTWLSHSPGNHKILIYQTGEPGAPLGVVCSDGRLCSSTREVMANDPRRLTREEVEELLEPPLELYEILPDVPKW